MLYLDVAPYNLTVEPSSLFKSKGCDMALSFNSELFDIAPLSITFDHFHGKAQFAMKLAHDSLELSLRCEKAKSKVTITIPSLDADGFKIDTEQATFVQPRYTSMNSLLFDIEAEHERLKELGELHATGFSLMERLMHREGHISALCRFAEQVADSGYDCGYTFSKLSPSLFKEGIFAIAGHRGTFSLSDLFTGTKGSVLYSDNGHNFLIDIIEQVMSAAMTSQDADKGFVAHRDAKRMYFCISFFAAMSVRWPELGKPVNGPLPADQVTAFIERWARLDGLNDGRLLRAVSVMQHISHHCQNVMASTDNLCHF